MNNVFTAKLLQNLQAKKKEGGFTLIELLVVVIIIGVLAAVALPNLLGQVGKAREAEAKNGIGSITRAQQGYHFEARNFAPAVNETDLQSINNALSLSLVSEFYDYDVAVSINNGDMAGATTVTTAGFTTGAAGDTDDLSGLAVATANNATSNGIREYAGQIAFESSTGNYGMAICQENGVASGTSPSVTTISFDDPSAAVCGGGILLR